MKILVAIMAISAFMLASVDINSATAKDFATLKGIGDKKAKTIVEYRKSIKCFKSIDELTKVKGIGKSTIAKNKKDLKLGICKK